MLGSILLDGGPSSGASSDVMGIALSALTVFNNVAGQDLPLLQLSLSSDIYAVNFLHTMNFLLTQSAETGDWVLLDEVLLFTHPVILGSGRPLFDGVTSPVRLEPLEQATYTGGVTMHR